MLQLLLMSNVLVLFIYIDGHMSNNIAKNISKLFILNHTHVDIIMKGKTCSSIKESKKYHYFAIFAICVHPALTDHLVEQDFPEDDLV